MLTFGRLISTTLFFIFKIVLAIIVPSLLHIHFRIILSVSTKNLLVGFLAELFAYNFKNNKCEKSLCDHFMFASVKFWRVPVFSLWFSSSVAVIIYCKHHLCGGTEWLYQKEMKVLIFPSTSLSPTRICLPWYLEYSAI